MLTQAALNELVNAAGDFKRAAIAARQNYTEKTCAAEAEALSRLADTAMAYRLDDQPIAVPPADMVSQEQLNELKAAAAEFAAADYALLRGDMSMEAMGAQVRALARLQRACRPYRLLAVPVAVTASADVQLWAAARAYADAEVAYRGGGEGVPPLDYPTWEQARARLHEAALAYRNQPTHITASADVLEQA